MKLTFHTKTELKDFRDALSASLSDITECHKIRGKYNLNIDEILSRAVADALGYVAEMNKEPHIDIDCGSYEICLSTSTLNHNIRQLYEYSDDELKELYDECKKMYYNPNNHDYMRMNNAISDKYNIDRNQSHHIIKSIGMLERVDDLLNNRCSFTISTDDFDRSVKISYHYEVMNVMGLKEIKSHHYVYLPSHISIQESGMVQTV